MCYLLWEANDFNVYIIINVSGFYSQFIDLCILLGCDYCDSIKGIGPKRAIELIKQHRSIEEILKHIDKKVGMCVATLNEEVCCPFLVRFDIR